MIEITYYGDIEQVLGEFPIIIMLIFIGVDGSMECNFDTAEVTGLKLMNFL